MQLFRLRIAPRVIALLATLAAVAQSQTPRSDSLRVDFGKIGNDTRGARVWVDMRLSVGVDVFRDGQLRDCRPEADRARSWGSAIIDVVLSAPADSASLRQPRESPPLLPTCDLRVVVDWSAGARRHALRLRTASGVMEVVATRGAMLEFGRSFAQAADATTSLDRLMARVGPNNVRGSSAPTPPPGAPGAPSAYWEFEVDRPARRIEPPEVPAGQTPPAPPDSMQQMRVIVTFIVDTLGVVEPGSARAATEIFVGFPSAALARFYTWRYEPAMLKNVKVRQMVQYPIYLRTPRR